MTELDSNDWNELEEYLIKQYEVHEDKSYLQDVSDIEDYFKDNGYDYFDCGQGYYQDDADVIVHIANKFYLVTMEAEISSQKQDRGDRLYFVEDIVRVEYREIDKPEKKTEYISIKVNENDIEKVLEFLESEGIEVSK